jgi:CO/xanthine dehydrogenase FAD-binding subunit
MKHFDYIQSHSIEEMCAALSQYGSDACVLAGGTDLLIEYRRTQSKMPKVVVDISRIKTLIGITESNGSVIIKPLSTHTQILKSSIVQQFSSLLASAVSVIGSPQIRNRGTIGGNIMNAAACADTVPPLIALGATIILQSKNGSRQMNLAELFVKPYTTHAKPDEVLTEIRFPKLSGETKSTFIKLGRRNALAISRLSVATILHVGRDGRIADARIVPGAVFPTWQRVSEAEQLLLGEKPSAKLFAAAGKKVSDAMIAHTGRRWSTEYKEPVIAVLVRRALQQCTQTNVMPNGVEA